MSRFGSRGNCVQKNLFQFSIDITDQGRGRRRLTSDFLGKLPLFLQVLNALRHQRRNPQPGRRLDERKLLAALKRVTKRLGLPGHVHTFRHTFISVAITRGVPEAVVRKWVGHVDPAILKYYTHISDASGQNEMQRLAAEIGQGNREASDAETLEK